ncbi:MAG: AAA family ATPase, partial [Lachnospiraceae bacterium]|nr:AAA family ATPase [Lachnospiraceae bacterium]
SVLQTNPYQLIDDLTHVGFRIADEIARSSGMAGDSEHRIRSGLHYAMMQALEGGHIFLPLATLVDYASHLLDLPEEPILREIDALHLDQRFVLKQLADVPVVYLASYYRMECGAAARLHDLNVSFPLEEALVEEELKRLEQEEAFPLEEKQRDAVRRAVLNGLTVITGGPGTGKTTIISAILRYFEAHELSVALAAPTGRAAKRITEATGRPAQTIHRLLEYIGAPEENRSENGELLRFTRNESYPLEQDVVILDEVSMVDLPLLYALLRALVPGTRLILAGDTNQLPSVGPGNVLKDIIRSGIVEPIALTRIFRQEEGSDIVVNAHRIIRGEWIDPVTRSKDFIFVQRRNPDLIRDVLVQLVRDKLPDYVKALQSDIQLISPTRKGPLGVENLNRILQEALNPPREGKKERSFAGGLFRQGDKVMQIKNNYQKVWTDGERQGTGVFNGDIGVIEDLRFFTEEVVILFDEERRAVYQFSEMNELELAYAITVHKAQGSEYPAVVIPLWGVPQPLISRALIYTAVTRARSCVCLVGEAGIFQSMIDNDKEQRRYSSLHLQLQELNQR